MRQKAREIYEKFKPELEPEHNGRFIAIDVASESYFLGDDLTAALLQAKANMPEAFFFILRVGKPDEPALSLRTPFLRERINQLNPHPVDVLADKIRRDAAAAGAEVSPDFDRIVQEWKDYLDRPEGEGVLPLPPPLDNALHLTFEDEEE